MDGLAEKLSVTHMFDHMARPNEADVKGMEKS